MNNVISFITQTSSHHELLSHICLQFLYNNLTTCHKKLQVFLELTDNHCAMLVILQDTQDQPQE